MSEQLTYRERLMLLRNGLITNPPKEKKPMRTESEKKIEKDKAAKEARGDNDSEMKAFFKSQRKKMVGVCQCGCARKSSKFDDLNFHASIAHIFPKSLFPSIATDPLNWVERNFWDGCHTNFDNAGMDKWPAMADWLDIRERYFLLAPKLSAEERAVKFYHNIEKLVYANP
jgi:hypothetical protein